MAVDDIYQLSMIFGQNGAEWACTSFYREAVADAEQSPTDIAAALARSWVETFYTANLDGCLSNEVDLIATVVQKIHPTRDFQATYTPQSAPGTVASPPMPAHTTAMFSQTGSDHGRSFQGRAYLSGMPRTFEQDGSISPTGVTAYDAFGVKAFGNNSIQPVDGSSLTLIHTNYSPKKAGLGEDKVSSDIQDAALSATLGTQRNRTLKTRQFPE